MKTALYALCAFLAFAAIVWLAKVVLKEMRKRMIAAGKLPRPEELCLLKEPEWAPRFSLEHRAVSLFHLPFEPDEHEVFYMENEYDVEANRFVRENKMLIEQKMAAKGFRFVYLPDVVVPEETLLRCVLYRNPSETTEQVRQRLARTGVLKESNMLLDYMVLPRNRNRIKSCFAWYGSSMTTHHDSHRIRKYIFDYISFDGSEANGAPVEVLDEICQELGRSKDWSGGVACSRMRDHDKETADERFDYDIQQLLDEVREKVNDLRMKGVSDAVISRYVRRDDPPSRLHVTHDLRIYLVDYQNREVRLEPLNKAVFLLFLRHEEGIYFKELVDYASELAAIYQCVKRKNNEIDRLMALDMPIAQNIADLTNPLNNSINEKCTRIKEAFLLLMHEDIACQYYVDGGRSERKRIRLDRRLVEWEGGESS